MLERPNTGNDTQSIAEMLLDENGTSCRHSRANFQPLHCYSSPPRPEVMTARDGGGHQREKEWSAMNLDMDPPAQLLVGIDEACRMLGGLGRSKLYNLVNAGELTKVSVGRRGFITTESLRAYVASLSGDRGADGTT